MSEKSAWLTIWTKPRETIRRILSDHPKQALWRLATIYGFVTLMGAFQSLGMGSIVWEWTVFFLSLLFAPIFGYLIFAIWSGIMLWVGKLFNGNGDFEGLRAAYAWASVPLLVKSIIWIVMLLFFGSRLFNPQGMNFHMFSGEMGVFLSALLLGNVVMSVWSFIIYLNAVAEVQQFSILQAIGSVILSAIILGFVIGVLAYIALFLIGLGAQDASGITSALSYPIYEHAVAGNF